MADDASSRFEYMSDEEIVAAARSGDAFAYDFLVSKYKGVAKRKSRKFYISGADNDDVVQEGMIGIFKAIRDFDPDAGVPFAAFADLCMERQIMTAISGANRDKHKILNESVPLETEDEGYESVFGRHRAGGVPVDAVNDPEGLAVMRETLKHIKSISKRVLSPMEEEVFSAMLVGRTYKEIAEDMGKPPKSIDNAIQRIKKKIRLGSSDIDIATKK